MARVGYPILLILLITAAAAAQPAAVEIRPNFVLIVADDLGYGELGCYGQARIETPCLDRMAAEGLRFTQFYSGAPVCAPSRCALLTGRHTGRCYVRGNLGRPRIGQLPLPAGADNLARRLQAAGYTTVGIGKWGLGGPGTTGVPEKQGFDHWFGYLDQWNAHSHYPNHIWRNGQRVDLEANRDGKQGAYTQDLFTADAVRFIREHPKNRSFFLYVPYAVPHVSLHVPDESVKPYLGRWPETPYKGGHYAGHATPRAAYAAMISHMDRDVGKILAALKERGFDKNTLVLFTSDNGPTYAGGVDAKFFNSAGGLRGLKGSLYEGGIRVPMIARWPGRVAAGKTSDTIGAFWDLPSTLLALAGLPGLDPVRETDGVSLAPALMGRPVRGNDQRALYWEAPVGRFTQAVRIGRWKAVRKNLWGEQPGFEVFDLQSDPGETVNLAGKDGKVDFLLRSSLDEERLDSEHFPGRPPLDDAPRKADRTWLGSRFFANRLQDWRLRGRRLECEAAGYRLPMRTVQLLDRRAPSSVSGLRVDVHLSRMGDPKQPVNPTAAAGFLVGVGNDLDWRSAAIVHGVPGRGAGIFAGLDGEGAVFLRDNEKPRSEPPLARGRAGGRVHDVRLSLVVQEIDRDEDGLCRLRRFLLTARHPITQEVTSEVALDVHAGRVGGGFALVSHPGERGKPGRPGRFAFRDWRVVWPGCTVSADRTFGPIAATQYTLSGGVLKLTAQLMPLGNTAPKAIRLEVREGEKWKKVAASPMDPESRTATFRVAGWDASRDVPYRVVCPLRSRYGVPAPPFTGTIRRDPVDKETIVVAGFTGNHNCSHRINRAPFDWATGMWFPHADLTERVAKHKPDLLFFSGDQIYEGSSPTFADRKHLHLDYLYKWYLWCWAYRDLTRDIPCVTIPDDHDVYQGNLWGEGGRKARRDHDGGYVHPAEFVKMVERTQVSHLPDPVDPAPVEQGIGVYFTALEWGRVGFAILEDRKFKSGCAGRLPPTGTKRPDHIDDPAFDVKKADVEGLSLLGARQLAFLERWVGDWRGTDLKVALSQTAFANLATHHGPNLRRLRADLDSNGWPQRGRDSALRTLRKGFVFHLCGDQHLATVVQHGLDEFRDGPWAFCVPSIANFYPRGWWPPEDGRNREAGAPVWTGDNLDGFGNRVTLYAATNPGKPSGLEPKDLHDKMPGYGIVRLNRRTRTITMECWPRHADPGAGGAQYPGWPRTIGQADNYARRPVAWLPRLEVVGMVDPVVRVRDAASGRLVYALRVSGGVFRPPVFRVVPHTVEIGDPDSGRWTTLRDLKPAGGEERPTIRVDLAAAKPTGGGGD